MTIEEKNELVMRLANELADLLSEFKFKTVKIEISHDCVSIEGVETEEAN